MVAHEVGKLAARTQNMSHEIVTSVDSIQDALDQTASQLATQFADNRASLDRARCC